MKFNQIVYKNGCIISYHYLTKAPFTRYNLLSTRLSNRFDNRVNVCIHDTTGCQTGLTTGCQTGCQTRLTTGLTTGWMFVYTIQPVVNPVVQPVWQPVVSCKRGLRKCCHSNKHFAELAPRHGGKNSQHTCSMKKLRHCHPMHSEMQSTTTAACGGRRDVVKT